MQTSKLIQTLRLLDAAELKRLLQFLKSPFYNVNPAIVKLYLHLRAYHPDYDAPALAKERVFKKLFPGRIYDHQKLLNLMSAFTALLEQYLTLLQLEAEEQEQQKLLLRAYARRPDCYSTFVKKVQDMHRRLDEQPCRDEQYFQEKTALSLLYFGHPGTDMVDAGRNALRDALQHFDLYKAIAGAKLQCAQNAWGYAVGARKTIENTAAQTGAANPVLQLYARLAQLEPDNTSPTALQELSGNFLEHIRFFGADDKSNILKILLNHYTRLVNKGNTEIIQSYFELYKTGLAYGCFLIHGKLKESSFHNIVTVGLNCREFEWTENFITTYQHLLPARVRADAMALAKGQWHIEKQAYLQATEFLQHEFSEPQDILKAKALLIRAWCELFWNDDRYAGLLFHQLDAFEKYTRRNKTVAPRLLQGVRKFIAYTRKLALIKQNGGDPAALKTAIDREPNVSLKSWLLTKAG